jgi:hypothetical protein
MIWIWRRTLILGASPLFQTSTRKVKRTGEGKVYMYQPIQLINTIPSLRNLINTSPLQRGFLLIPLGLALAWFALSPAVRAVSPPPDGGYPNGNTAEGDGALASNTSGADNTAIGNIALSSNTTGGFNTAAGWLALSANIDGIANTATGANSLQNNTSGFDNTATGVEALFSNTTGQENTATGRFALSNNTTGNDNTAAGWEALAFNTTGEFNTATGVEALVSNTTGHNNTANGADALASNTTGVANTATGSGALQSNTTASENTADGSQALFSNTTGVCNAALGFHTLRKSTTGRNNTATGWGAMEFNTTGNNNTASGFEALYNNTTGRNNIALGNLAGFNITTGGNNIDIGNHGLAAEANTIRIGTQGTQTGTFIAGISGVAVSGSTVVVNSSGKLGVATSSARFKQNIKPMDKASEAILALKPVTFCYKEDIDPDGIPQFGLVAEEVEKINPDLVVRGEDGKVMTVRYEAVNAMLLNEFLKEHGKVEEQERNAQEQQSTITALKGAVAQQQMQIEALTAGPQKVNEQVALSKPAPQLVANP